MAGPSRTVEQRAPTATLPALELQRSARRRRTATAFVRDGRVVVQLPAGLDAGEEQRLVESLVGRVTGRARAERSGGDAALARRARELAEHFVPGAVPISVRWSNRMGRRYGSCTPADGSIRISSELAAYPGYVLDHVLVHELAHLVVPDHSPAFHAITAAYPHRERARGFLEGIRAATGQALDPLRDAVDDDVHIDGDEPTSPPTS